MAAKPKARIPPEIDPTLLEENFSQQLASGSASDATATDTILPPLLSPRGQSSTVDRCILRSVTLSHPGAQRLRMRDSRIENADLANINLTGSSFERLEFLSTRLTGATCSEAHWNDVLFQECKLDLALLRMARLERCVFERCNLTDADFYAADLTGVIFRKCDLSRADLSHAKLAGADIRSCCIDGMRGTPATMDGLLISADQAPLLITLFGVRVEL